MPIYLDNAATSFPKPESVYSAVMRTMRETGASPGRGGYRMSLECSRLLYKTREAIARLFSISDTSRVIFTHSATESLNMALRGTLLPGDHVITSVLEHNSLIRPLKMLEKQGVKVTLIEAAGDGVLDPDDFASAIRPDTRMIAVGHASNVTGRIQPVSELADVARKAGALFLLDAAQTAGSVEIDVSLIGIDLLALPGHKGLYGPQGTGILYAGEKVKLRPLLYGGTGTDSIIQDQPEIMPEGFEAGTHNISGIAGLKAGVEFVLEKTVSEIGRRELELAAFAACKIEDMTGARVHGFRKESSAGLFSFTIEGIDPAEISYLLDRDFDISSRSGLHCAPGAHRAVGTFPEGTVRISPGWFNTSDEMKHFLDALTECVRSLRG